MGSSIQCESAYTEFMNRLRVAILLSLFIVAIGRAAQPVEADAARDKWQRVAELIAAMGAREGSRVADVGAGRGYMTIRLAAAVGPSGKVYAVDIAADALKALRERAANQKLANVEVIEGAEDDPRLPASSLDAAVMINTYHDITQSKAVLAHLREALKTDGRLVLCEPRPMAPGQTREEQVKRHVLSPDLIVAEVKEAGFEIVRRDDSFTANPSGPEPAPYSLVVARKP